MNDGRFNSFFYFGSCLIFFGCIMSNFINDWEILEEIIPGAVFIGQELYSSQPKIIKRLWEKYGSPESKEDLYLI